MFLGRTFIVGGLVGSDGRMALNGKRITVQKVRDRTDLMTKEASAKQTGLLSAAHSDTANNPLIEKHNVASNPYSYSNRVLAPFECANVAFTPAASTSEQNKEGKDGLFGVQFNQGKHLGDDGQNGLATAAAASSSSSSEQSGNESSGNGTADKKGIITAVATSDGGVQEIQAGELVNLSTLTSMSQLQKFEASEEAAVRARILVETDADLRAILAKYSAEDFQKAGADALARGDSELNDIYHALWKGLNDDRNFINNNYTKLKMDRFFTSNYYKAHSEEAKQYSGLSATTGLPVLAANAAKGGLQSGEGVVDSTSSLELKKGLAGLGFASGLNMKTMNMLTSSSASNDSTALPPSGMGSGANSNSNNTKESQDADMLNSNNAGEDASMGVSSKNTQEQMAKKEGEISAD